MNIIDLKLGRLIGYNYYFMPDKIVKMTENPDTALTLTSALHLLNQYQ